MYYVCMYVVCYVFFPRDLCIVHKASLLAAKETLKYSFEAF
jgi:hypothetical protein